MSSGSEVGSEDRREHPLFAYSAIGKSPSRYFAAWRGGSAIVVLIGHTFQVSSARPHMVWGVFASCAVLVFFALSGFFIHKALAKSISGGSIMPFLTGRLNRVLPPFVLSLALVVALWLFAPFVFATGTRDFLTPTARSSFSLDGLLPSAVFLNGFVGPTISANGPLWSLSYEIWYYVLAGLAGCAALSRKPFMVIAGIALFASLTVLDGRFLLLGTVWFLGFGLSALHGRNNMPTVPEWPFLAACVACLALASFPVGIPGALTFAQLTTGLWFVIHMAKHLREATSPTLALFESASDYSYTLYVVHFPLLLFAYGASGERPWVAFPAAFAILLVTARVGRRLEKIQLISRPSSVAQAVKSV